MAQTIKLKRSATPGAIPSLESLELGEVALNTNDGAIYIKRDDGTSPLDILAIHHEPTMHIDYTNNRIGIGTDSPEKNLSIGSSQAEGIQFTFDTTNNYRNQILNYWNTSADSRMDFNIARSSGAVPSTIMSVGYNSNVGIGTTTPASTLDLTKGTDTAERAIKIQNDTVVLYTGVEGSTGNRFVGSAVGNAFFGTTSAHGLELATNNNVRMTIDSAGNAAFAGDIATPGIQMGSGVANDIQADGKTASFGSAIFGDSLASNTPLAPVHIKGAGAPALRIEDRDGTNQIYDFISNQGVGLSIVDQTASITPLVFAHTTGDATFAGDVTVSGDLFVTGASTSVNVEDLNVEQGEITLNFGAGDTSAAANGAGIRIQDAVDASTDATILWNATSDKFEFSHGIISAGPITVSNLSGTNTGDETKASINALDITEVGTITSGIWTGSVIASAYLDADTAHLSGTQTFTGQKNFNSSGGTIPLNISRSGSNANQVLSIGVTDTTAEFNYIEDTSGEGTGAYGSYVFKVSGNEVTSPTITVLTLDENQAKLAGTVYTRGATSLVPDATQPGAIILANGGSEASPSTDGRGIEFLTADVNNGYGHRIVSFDNSTGDTPLLLQRRNNNAAWATQITFEGNSNNATFAGAISASNLSGTNTGDETKASINALDITEVGTITSGIWTGSVIASAYLDADTAHLSGTQTFTGNKTFSGGLGVSSIAPAFLINDSDATNATNQVGFISFQRQSVEKAWIGYGSSGSPNFTIKNNEGAVTIDSNVDVIGTLAATSKSFDIEHPTKEGMRLRYGSLEGPENGVYVRGRMDGEQVIQLPDYWLGLVHEDTITVNLTSIGPGSVWVESIENNTITVGGSEKFFYHVFAERKDIEKLTVEYDV